MRKILLFFILTAFIVSCSITGKLTRQLEGKYAVSMTEQTSDNGISGYSDTVLKELLKDSYLKFDESGNYEMLIAGKKINGKWNISEDGKKVLTDKEDIFFEISEFNDDILILNSFYKGKKQILYLKKISE